MPLVICNDTFSLTKLESAEKKDVVLLGGESLITLLNKSGNEQVPENFIHQLTQTHRYKKHLFSNKENSADVSYYIEKSCVDAASDHNVIFLVNQLIQWGNQQKSNSGNFIILSAFKNTNTIHIDIVTYTNGVLVDISEVRNVMAEGRVYTQKVIDTIIEKRTGELGSHRVFLVGNVNYDNSGNSPLANLHDDINIDKAALDREIENCSLLGMKPFVKQNTFKLIEKEVKINSPLLTSLGVSALLLVLGIIPFSLINSFKQKSFVGLQEENVSITQNIDSNVLNEHQLSQWKAKKSYLKILESNKTNHSNSLKLTLQALSTADNSLPHLDIAVRQLKYEGEEANRFSILIGAKASDFEDSIEVGSALFNEISSSMSKFAYNLESSRLPRSQGRGYYVFEFEGNFRKEVGK